MNTKRRFVAIIPVIIIGTLFLTIGAYFFLFQKGVLLPQATRLSSTPNSTSDTTTDWETYSTKTYSYKLPPGVDDFRCDMSACWSTSTRLPTGATIGIRAGGPETVNTEKTWQDILEELRSKSVIYYEKTISGKKAIYITTKEEITPFDNPYTQGSQLFQGIVINSERGRWLSIFIYKFDKEYKPLIPSEKEVDILNQILSTFKFLTPISEDGCIVGGCNGELCTDESEGPATSICLYREEFACYKTATCERQEGGKCGWTQSAELKTCLQKAI